MAYEWDEDKNFSNYLKHRVRFEEATETFEDPYRLVMEDYHPSEQRYICLGMNPAIGLLVVVYCERNNLVRIISARKPSPGERRFYEKRI